jgi:hypothetical protein
MQRYALFLSGYDYKSRYKNTKTHDNADCLSRLPLSDCEPDDEVDINLLYLTQFDTLPITSDRIRQETGRDPVLSRVYERDGIHLLSQMIRIFIHTLHVKTS